jgi:Large polyvalent protein-associated domain 7
MDNLVFAIGSLSKIAENATVNPCIVSLHQLSSLPWNRCPVCAGISVQFPVESLSTLPWNTQESQKQRNKAQRGEFMAAQKAKQLPPKIAVLLWSFHIAQEREILQKRQAKQRADLGGRMPGSKVWRKWLERQAERGDEAARSALRGIRYREQRHRNKMKDGIEGEDLEPLRPLLANLRAEVDRKNLRVHYVSQDGRTLFTDTGPRIEVHDTTDKTLEAALRLSAQKFGGEVVLTGSTRFKERATRMAAHLGIRVSNKDLKQGWENESHHSRHQICIER